MTIQDKAREWIRERGNSKDSFVAEVIGEFSHYLDKDYELVKKDWQREAFGNLAEKQPVKQECELKEYGCKNCLAVKPNWICTCGSDCPCPNPKWWDAKPCKISKPPLPELPPIPEKLPSDALYREYINPIILCLEAIYKALKDSNK